MSDFDTFNQLKKVIADAKTKFWAIEVKPGRQVTISPKCIHPIVKRFTVLHISQVSLGEVNNPHQRSPTVEIKMETGGKSSIIGTLSLSSSQLVLDYLCEEECITLSHTSKHYSVYFFGNTMVQKHELVPLYLRTCSDALDSSDLDLLFHYAGIDDADFITDLGDSDVEASIVVCSNEAIADKVMKLSGSELMGAVIEIRRERTRCDMVKVVVSEDGEISDGNGFFLND